MLSITDLKKDTMIQLDNVPYRVVEYAQKQMGRGGSIVNTKLKNLLDGSVLSKTFKGNDKLEEAEITNRKVQFLYREGDTFHFMDEANYDQFEANSDLVGPAADFLKEGATANAQYFVSKVINIELPIKVELEVVEAPEVSKGDTQSTVQKTITLENGTEIQAPIFIKAGDTVVVDTRDGSYVERAK